MTKILYYSEEELYDKIEDFSALKEYLNGWKDSVFTEEGIEYFEAKYVDMYLNR